jgi:hypothetical protein
LDLP